MVKPMPAWFDRAMEMEVNDIIAIETLSVTEGQVLSTKAREMKVNPPRVEGR